MRHARTVGLVLALALLAGVMPAQAQGNPAVTDQGNNIRGRAGRPARPRGRRATRRGSASRVERCEG